MAMPEIPDDVFQYLVEWCAPYTRDRDGNMLEGYAEKVVEQCWWAFHHQAEIHELNTDR